MGRWFGFRPGYRDLVRLYIARQARSSAAKTVDLYEAFESIAATSALPDPARRYTPNGRRRPRSTPAQIPPLVAQHLPWLDRRPGTRCSTRILEEQSEQPFTPTGYPNRTDRTSRRTFELGARRHSGIRPSAMVLPAGRRRARVRGVRRSCLRADANRASSKTEYLPLYRGTSRPPQDIRFLSTTRQRATGSKSSSSSCRNPNDRRPSRAPGYWTPPMVSRDLSAGRHTFGETTDKNTAPSLLCSSKARQRTSASTRYSVTQMRSYPACTSPAKGHPTYDLTDIRVVPPAPSGPSSPSAFSVYVPEQHFEATDARSASSACPRHQASNEAPTIDAP